MQLRCGKYNDETKLEYKDTIIRNCHRRDRETGWWQGRREDYEEDEKEEEEEEEDEEEEEGCGRGPSPIEDLAAAWNPFPLRRAAALQGLRSDWLFVVPLSDVPAGCTKH
ncbi:hypothetical protein EAG_02728 [Camponotus floridanus]|uniref:Uncharacterized protein n=1 Tax=Camponotus floridanus TaxID=104421 RepID=E2AFN0_CAMFO|nr:hypothetical protein EAG_02728 [Camponotus floridanus]